MIIVRYSLYAIKHASFFIYNFYRAIDDNALSLSIKYPKLYSFWTNNNGLLEKQYVWEKSIRT